MMPSNRRNFLRQSAALGVGFSLAIRAKAAGPNDKINVACIGVRGRGNSVMRTFAAEPDCAITHICDVRKSVREQRAAEIKSQHGHTPKRVNDYRVLLDDKSVDVFMVATPDHWHALPTIHGCLAGKDVYVEKPASHNIVEGKTAVAAARKYDRIVQMGTQIRSAPFLAEAMEYVKSGALGKVIYGKAWETSRNGVVHLAKDSDPRRASTIICGRDRRPSVSTTVRLWGVPGDGYSITARATWVTMASIASTTAARSWAWRRCPTRSPPRGANSFSKMIKSGPIQ